MLLRLKVNAPEFGIFTIDGILMTWKEKFDFWRSWYLTLNQQHSTGVRQSMPMLSITLRHDICMPLRISGQKLYVKQK